MKNDFITKYDEKVFNPGIQYLYKKNNFCNVGDWSDKTKSITQACQALTLRHIFDENNIKIKSKSILDVACGLGAGTELIATEFPESEVIGINISPKQIKHCNQNQDKKAKYQVMDAANLSFEKSSFDLITCVESSFHFDTRKDFLASSFDKLKEGGYLIFTDIMFFDTTYIGKWSIPEQNNIIDLDAYNADCKEAGFTITSQEDITNVTWKSFCDYMHGFESQERKSLSDNLKKSVAYYIITKLKK